MSGLVARPFGPLDALYAAVRRRLPQILVAHVGDPEEYLRVTYGDRGPADIVWDADTGEYRWTAGADPTKRVGGPDIEEAVQSIAEHLHARTTGAPPTRQNGGPNAAAD